MFDIKRDGRFRPRLAACGYSQIPGVDFTHSFAPVISDQTWKILLAYMMLTKCSSKIVDVETAFLEGTLDEDIYMEIPEGMDGTKDECVKLRRSIYGLVQAARQYYTLYIKSLRDCGFTGGRVDPCLMMRKNEKGVVYVAIWVDDSLLVGDDAAIDATIEDLQKAGFKLKIEGSLDDYLSCQIITNEKGDKGWIQQPHLIKKIDKAFGQLVRKMKVYKTPASTGIKIVRNEDGPKINQEMQKTYRSGVGMLLYLVKHTRPDIANAVRELSKVLDGASPAAYKELMRCIKYVLDTRDLSLKFSPKLEEGQKWNIIAYSDSDWATDPETRISITGFILYLCGVPISWKSKTQKSVTLSSTEAEYVAMSETAKEISFIYQILESMGIKVELPIIVRVDNIGAIFMAENRAVSQRTKHVDTRLRFVNEFIEKGFIKIRFVKTDENNADLFTKNLGSELHERHTKDMMEVSDLSTNKKGVGESIGTNDRRPIGRTTDDGQEDGQNGLENYTS